MCIKTDKIKPKGGVAIYIDKKYNYTIREDVSLFIESVFLEITNIKN